MAACQNTFSLSGVFVINPYGAILVRIPNGILQSGSPNGRQSLQQMCDRPRIAYLMAVGPLFHPHLPVVSKFESTLGGAWRRCACAANNSSSWYAQAIDQVRRSATFMGISSIWVE